MVLFNASLRGAFKKNVISTGRFLSVQVSWISISIATWTLEISTLLSLPIVYASFTNNSIITHRTNDWVKSKQMAYHTAVIIKLIFKYLKWLCFLNQISFLFI